MKLLSSNAPYKIQFYYGKKSEGMIQELRNSYDPKKEIRFLYLPLKLLRNRDVGIIKENPTDTGYFVLVSV
ncbi:hypothetical protein AB1K32_26075 [Metabacillus dongyingensis]|uniref:hypothetical protein n=1 Tax=Metabacillus dongyingensis TaxID=2874282 RepID=UPI003B8CC511